MIAVVSCICGGGEKSPLLSFEEATKVSLPKTEISDDQYCMFFAALGSIVVRNYIYNA